MTRFRAIAHPGYRRAMMLRRLLAVGLLVVAGASLLIDAHANDPLTTTFRQPVAAGAVLTEEDVVVKRLPPEVVPEGAITDPAVAIGQIVAAGAAAGEVVTTMRLVGPDLVTQLVEGEPPGEPFTMVPLALAETDIMPMLTHGAHVDVVAEGPAIIASGGRIVTVGDNGTVLVLLRQSQAAAVAAASLAQPLTVVLKR
ncbi:SAF domain-containing protein [Corynebacterium sp. HMSC29G08]|uniref:SAF domain-containing protein n=1 Tax=Corynebacterium sp. HMSC29G08 TaxID=1581069 RepID=UPI0008A4011B|nr:SAF domain-containing protein [Corynebacterium sp. HMSC29G08]OFT81877.1 hypothetical protein HMPREF3101_09255 [Corynebacterium sp. HMSC29G08]